MSSNCAMVFPRRRRSFSNTARSSSMISKRSFSPPSIGSGRTAALLIGDLWQSGLGDEAMQKDLGKAWRQLVRWLVADVPEPIELHAEPQPGGELVRLLVRVRDGKFQPMENSAVT